MVSMLGLLEPAEVDLPIACVHVVALAEVMPAKVMSETTLVEICIH